MDILKNPTTVKLLVAQIIKACDAYIAMENTIKYFKGLILYYDSKHGTKIFSAKGFNPQLQIV